MNNSEFRNRRLLNLKYRIRNLLISKYNRIKLNSPDFTIISNNCIGGWIYQKVGVRYRTPTIGCFFFSEDYIKFLENLQNYIKLPLTFKKISKYPQVNEARSRKSNPYPIGLLGDIEIQFVHYKTEKEAYEKWMRRKQRINFENLFIMYSDRDGFQEDFLVRYNNLTFPHKIFFSSKPMEPKNLVVFIPDYANQNEVGHFLDREYEKYIDLLAWLNKSDNFIKNK